MPPADTSSTPGRYGAGSGSLVCGAAGRVTRLDRPRRLGITVSLGVAGLTTPENVTSVSIRWMNRGPAPNTRRKPSRLVNGPWLMRSATMCRAMVGVTPGSESICAAVATSRSSRLPMYPGRSSSIDGRDLMPVSAAAAPVCGRRVDFVRADLPRPFVRPACAEESAAWIWCSSAGCAGASLPATATRVTRTAAPSTATAPTKTNALCSAEMDMCRTYSVGTFFHHRFIPTRRRITRGFVRARASPRHDL